MRTLGPGSIASILKLALTVLHWSLWGLLGFGSFLIVLIIFVGLYSFVGIGPGVPAGLTGLLNSQLVILIAMATPATGALTFIVNRLVKIFSTLEAGDPFVPENALHLRSIAIGIAVFNLIVYAAHGVIALIFTLVGNSVESGGRVFGEFSLNLGAWFAVIAFFVLAEVFREGTRLRDEQKFTI